MTTLPDLIARASALPPRSVLAIAGPPGAGKSTLVEGLAAAIPGAAVLPMDGFHYDDAVLHAMGRRPWKGAPDTFDVGGLRATLRRLRDPAEGTVAVPVFDRDLEISRGSARLIGREAGLIIAEGNWLLLDADPWRSLHPLFDLTVLLDVPEDALRRRLTARWQGHGLPAAEIARRVEDNDLPNGRRVRDGSISADLRLRG